MATRRELGDKAWQRAGQKDPKSVPKGAERKALRQANRQGRNAMKATGNAPPPRQYNQKGGAYTDQDKAKTRARQAKKRRDRRNPGQTPPEPGPGRMPPGQMPPQPGGGPRMEANPPGQYGEPSYTEPGNGYGQPGGGRYDNYQPMPMPQYTPGQNDQYGEKQAHMGMGAVAGGGFPSTGQGGNWMPGGDPSQMAGGSPFQGGMGMGAQGGSISQLFQNPQFLQQLQGMLGPKGGMTGGQPGQLPPVQSGPQAYAGPRPY